MDFKSLINKLDSMEAPPSTPKAPELPKVVQLDEDHALKVLAGTKTVMEATDLMEKAVSKNQQQAAGAALAAKKSGDTSKLKGASKEMAKMSKSDLEDFAKTKHKDLPEEKKTDESVDLEEAEKTATTWTDSKGNKHPATKVKGDKYTGKDAEKEEKKVKKESIDTEAFAEKFMHMVAEAKKKKPDDDGDGVPNWADKKPGEDDNADKKKSGDKKGMSAKQAKYFGKKKAVKEADEMKAGEKKASSTGGTIEKTKTGLKHTAGKNYGGKAAEDEAKKSKKDESVTSKKKVVAESVESALSFREMMKLVVESGGQQQIDPMDKELFAWATRVARTKLGEGMKADVYAGMVYERMGGVFEMYDVLSETKK
jgi:hypothetical protein